MNLKKRLDLISSVGEEIITEEELAALLEEKKNPIAYDGFEPSGQIHIAQGLLRAISINKLTEAGCTFYLLVADWHALANNKMGGDLEAIRNVGKYFIEVWKACGMDLDKVKFIWASDLVQDNDYWMKVMRIAMANTVKRITRCSQIMGRKESESLSAAQILYPCMQAADIFHLKVDICQLGMDQRKVNMLAREIGEKLGYWKPVAVHHHMLMGLGTPAATGAESAVERTIELKMSKSKPDSAIFMTDSPDDVHRKINKAYCPERQVQENPVLEYARYLVFERLKSLDIDRPAKFGGPVSFKSYSELELAYTKGELHPADLKKGVAEAVNTMLEPVRKHFSADRKAAELQDFVLKQKVTR